MEFFKELDEENRMILVDFLNEWWNNENMDPEKCKARVVMIFKKGDTSKLGNYTQISPLNSVYKVFTSILVNIIQNTLDKDLHNTQYVFLKRQIYQSRNFPNQKTN